jgi:hypothetical protein
MMKVGAVLAEMPGHLRALCKNDAGTFFDAVRACDRIAWYGDKTTKPENIVLALKGVP